MSKVIVITSGKGGVGKTTSTANIGSALSALGKKVVIVDADIGLRNLDVVMGLENRIVFDIIDIIEKRCTYQKAMIRDKRFNNLFLIPAELQTEFDYVLIDCPAGIENGFKNAVAGANQAIVVTTPEVSAVRDADRIIGMLEAAGLNNPKLIVNRIRLDMVKQGNMLNVEDMIDILRIDLIGIVPDDENIVISTNKGEPVVLEDKGLASKAYKNIARRLEGEMVEFVDLDVQESFFEKLKALFKK